MVRKIKFYIFLTFIVSFGITALVALVESKVLKHRAETIAVLQQQLDEQNTRLAAVEKSLSVYIRRKEVVKDATKNFMDGFTDHSWLSEPCPATFTELYNNATAKIFGTCDVENTL